MTRRKNSIDKMYQGTFQNWEAEVTSSDWEKMEALLVKGDDVAPIVPPLANVERTNKNNKIMFNSIVLAMFSSILMSLGFNPTARTTETATETKKVNVEDKETRVNKPDEIAYETATLIETKNVTGVLTNLPKATYLTTPVEFDVEPPVTPPTEPPVKEKVKEVVAEVVGGLVDSTLPEVIKPLVAYKVTKEEWVEPEYEYVYTDRKNYSEQGWMGIHYMQENAFVPDSLASTTHGFNLQFMSKNALNNSDFGIYGGLDWGMQFHGRSDRTDVNLSTGPDDIGYTMLKSLSHTFLVRGHAEYARYRLIPYVTAFAGPRMYFTGQKVALYETPEEVDGTVRENVQTVGVMQAGVGAGARIRVVDGFSIDARYELAFANDKEVVDVNNSYLSGTNYNFAQRIQAGNAGQFKIGLIFDFSEQGREKELVKEGYYREVKETYFYDPNSQRFLNNCDCDEKESKKDERNYSDRDCETSEDEPRKRIIDHLLDGMDSGNDWGSDGWTPSGGGGGGGIGVGDIIGPVIKN